METQHYRRKEIHMSTFRKIAASAATLAALTWSTGAFAASAPTKIVVADAKTTHHLNLYVAQEKGYFAKRKLDVEIVDVVDLAAARDLLVSGKADVFWACPTAAIAAIANGAPIQIISQVKKPCTSVLVVSPDSPIKEWTDLKDKRIAGISPTCEAVISITKQARKANSPFALEKLAGGPAIAALEAKAVDGAILEEPHVSIAELKGYKILFPNASASIPCRTINARTAFIKENTAALKAFIEAIAEANKFILAAPAGDEVVAIAAKYTGAPADAIRHGNHRLKFQTKLEVAGLSDLADDLVAQGSIKENPGLSLYAPEFKGITWGK
ncbi:MAG: ABC transporter substrate-binding protein [Deltaproteobacteria bacterium]|nr:ABC transporter substrate-binding protein [Deltaproteobacteria bacterium]